MIRKRHIILYVLDQRVSTAFYEVVLGLKPRLNVPGMTEFDLGGETVLGLMPEASATRLLEIDAEKFDAARTTPRAEVYLIVDDPLLYEERAKFVGAVELSPLLPRDWGHEAAYCLDLDGHVLAFAREL